MQRWSGYCDCARQKTEQLQEQVNGKGSADQEGLRRVSRGLRVATQGGGYQTIKWEAEKFVPARGC
uniref:Uncharacterized protein n=1 Tax=Peronospora matthiolae TaxID=2874970 RepID=A0AAV1TR72_9STRA